MDTWPTWRCPVFETVALPAPAPDSAPDWPSSWAEVPGERFDHDGVEYAVVSVPAGTDDSRIRRDLAPMRCEGGIVYLAVREDGCDVATCSHACPGRRGLYPVELAGRESCRRELVPMETE
jgi:hypothetical protein